MADITIATDAHTVSHIMGTHGGPFWRSTLIGYAFYTDDSQDLICRKTTDGGATWGSPIIITPDSQKGFFWDCYADWQTEGDAGTKIHIVYMEMDEGSMAYRYFDTSTDTVSDPAGHVETCQGSGQFHAQVSREKCCTSITKTRGGNLAIALRYHDNLDAAFYSFYTSSDGSAWNSKTSPWEADSDYMQLYPGNEADTQDIWAAFWDISANAISLKTYDDSGNSWSEQAIVSSMAESGTYLQWDGQIRLSDGHLIFAAWDALGYSGTANLMVWDINGASSITAKTNLIADTQHYFLASIFVNQINDDIYVAYIGGTGILSEVTAVYKKSTDGGSTWGSQTAMQADAEDDERWIGAGCLKAAWGGKFQPFWYNDDLEDLFCSTDNAISIALAAVPTATAQDATNVERTVARINGEITDDGGVSCEARFRYRKVNSWTETSWQNTLETDEEYHTDLTGIDEGTEYEFQTQAKNSAGEGGWSSSEYFETEDTWRDHNDPTGRSIQTPPSGRTVQDRTGRAVQDITTGRSGQTPSGRSIQA